ncbi:hypothetical protein B0J11DRAFT_528987 [Dendryphion nanum]|uniref:Uncharacterized protein n=1 Tax=Dendryphion nanum TaxID=256645 RepID=A0A9P9DW94_9PLEO|nr:hypothetical protein B0J11DRAFT_528987 [Dendryphion nanum]
MAPLALTLLTLSSLLLISPTIAAPVTQESNPCIPTLYTIDNYLRHFKSIRERNNVETRSNVTFKFTPTFSNPAIITDPALSGSTCFAESENEPIGPNNACSTGKDSVSFSFGPTPWIERVDIAHSWKCNGLKWSSHSAVKLSPLYGSGSSNDDGGFQGVESGGPFTVVPGGPFTAMPENFVQG